MLCHWPGMYTHGTKQGFQALQQVVLALHDRFADRMLWMKPSEMARYWAAKELTKIQVQESSVSLAAPFACPQFTLRIAKPFSSPPIIRCEDQQQASAASEQRHRAQGRYLAA